VFIAAARHRLTYWEWPRLLPVVPAVGLGAAVMATGLDSRSEAWIVLPAAALFALVVLTSGLRLEKLHMGEIIRAGSPGRLP
jgi:hypothetical protein